VSTVVTVFKIGNGPKILKTGYHRIMTDFPDLLRTVTALEIFRVWGPDFE
jgi:hypothetical protein